MTLDAELLEILVCPNDRGELDYQQDPEILVCRTCGSFTEFSDAELDSRIQEQARSHGFALQSHSLELYGLCPACARQAR